MVQKTFRIVAICIAGIVGIEIIYFVSILAQKNHDQSTDAVVVFTGGAGRIQRGYELLKDGVSNLLIVSAATKAQLKTFDKAYQFPEGATHLVEDRAETTFQNALFVGNVIQEKGLKSATLVTSWYHMPRSYLLMRMVLLNSGIEVHQHVAESDGNTRFTLKADSVRFMIYEIGKLWGSLAEFALYKISPSTDYTDGHRS
jgi:uncharacterized SAM-binding protein YcdF (DUF218 family)